MYRDEQGAERSGDSDTSVDSAVRFLARGEELGKADAGELRRLAFASWLRTLAAGEELVRAGALREHLAAVLNGEIAERAEDARARGAEAAALELVDADLAPIRERLDSIGATNRKVEDNARAAEAERVAERKAADYAAMTARIEALQAERAARIAAAALPVDGLGFDADGGMTFRGLPFAQASMAERMRVALAVAMRRDPRPPVLFISDAALLDDDSLAAVREAAEEHGVHVLIERVGDRDPGAVVIECGRVRS